MANVSEEQSGALGEGIDAAADQIKAAVSNSVALTKELEARVEGIDDPNELLRIVREHSAKLQGQSNYQELSDSEAADCAASMFLGWVVLCGRAPLDMKTSAKFFVEAVKGVIKDWPTDAQSQTMRIKKLLGVNVRGAWKRDVYQKEIPGYDEMSRDERTDAENGLRQMYRTHKYRIKKKLKSP